MAKFGIVIPNGFRSDLPTDVSATHQFEIMTMVAKEAERLGFYSAFMFDHLEPSLPTDTCFECYSALAAIAMCTSKLRLGQLVTCASYRNPALLAKMAATLDVITNGRLEFGIGAGWYEDEYRAYGYRFDPPAVRVRQLREAVQIVKKMWTEERATFRGQYYTVEEAITRPKPIQKPHPPIMIAGVGEKVLLKVVAQLADRSNFIQSVTLEDSIRKYRLIEQYCESFGRDPQSVERTLHREVFVANDRETALANALRSKPDDIGEEAFLAPRIVGDPGQCVDQFNKYVEKAAVRYFTLRVADIARLESLRLLGREVLPKVAD